jgi:hypothetical protein
MRWTKNQSEQFVESESSCLDFLRLLSGFSVNQNATEQD